MTTWMYWLVAVMVCSLLYNVSLKLASGQVPVWGYMMLSSAFMAAAALSFYYLEPSSANWEWLQGQSLVYALAAGLVLALLELSMFAMYGAGAPVALARALTASVSMVALLVVGVLFFKESLSPVQSLGVFVALAGVVMMVWR